MKRFELPRLSYELNALEPQISSETLHFHYNKHHQGYVDKLNKLISGSGFEDRSLEDLVLKASGPLFNNAAQHWNHSFYWQCLTPHGTQKPGSRVGSAIDRDFGSYENFWKAFDQAASEHFGSGWAWLVSDRSGKLSIRATHDADNPMKSDLVPILTADVWEHAYYIDHRNDRAAYLKNFKEIVNWDFVESRFNDLNNPVSLKKVG